MEAATPWKTENRLGDITSGFDDGGFRGLETLGIENDKRPTGLVLSLAGKPAVQASVFERRVGRPVVGELPAEDGAIELLGFVDVGAAELDVVDAEVVAHGNIFTNDG